MKNKKLVVTLGAVALIAAIGVGSTFAYLTATTDTVTNTFTIGEVTFTTPDPDPNDPDSSINSGLVESAVERDETGAYVDADGDDTWTVTGNDYTDVLPGEVIYKDPTVLGLTEDSVDAYVFVTVAGEDESLSVTEYSSEWTELGKTDDGKTVLYRVYDSADAKKTPSTIFSSVTVSTDADEDTEFTDIVINAYAIQMAGFDSPEAAFAQFSEQAGTLK